MKKNIGKSLRTVLLFIVVILFLICELVAFVFVDQSANEKGKWIIFWVILIANIPVFLSVVVNVFKIQIADSEKDFEKGESSFLKFFAGMTLLGCAVVELFSIYLNISQDKKEQLALPIYSIMCEEASNYDTGFYVKKFDDYSCFITVNNGVVVDEFDRWVGCWDNCVYTNGRCFQRYLEENNYTLEDYKIIQLDENSFFYELKSPYPCNSKNKS